MGVRTLGALAILLAAPLHGQTRAEPDMPRAYYIAEFEPTVPGAIKPYSERVESTLKPFGGRFIVRGGTLQALEGPAPKGVVVIIEFDSLERAQAWYRSPAYEALKPIRQSAGTLAFTSPKAFPQSTADMCSSTGRIVACLHTMNGTGATIMQKLYPISRQAPPLSNVS
ncbi:DUF1330 domain-containing protein [Arthrobacter sp. NPDC080086]|uniref:DUF1330 domain-containing protein n=1 Tax=Arthrobacter sp. NPDC080086 TaxID=3155917 RepID=UPI00344D9B47